MIEIVLKLPDGYVSRLRWEDGALSGDPVGQVLLATYAEALAGTSVGPPVGTAVSEGYLSSEVGLLGLCEYVGELVSVSGEVPQWAEPLGVEPEPSEEERGMAERLSQIGLAYPDREAPDELRSAIEEAEHVLGQIWGQHIDTHKAGEVRPDMVQYDNWANLALEEEARYGGEDGDDLSWGGGGRGGDRGDGERARRLLPGEGGGDRGGGRGGLRGLFERVARAFHLPGRHDQRTHGRRGPQRWGNSWPGPITARGCTLRPNEEAFIREMMAELPRRFMPGTMEVQVIPSRYIRQHFVSLVPPHERPPQGFEEGLVANYQPKSTLMVINHDRLFEATATETELRRSGIRPVFGGGSQAHDQMRIAIAHEMGHYVFFNNRAYARVYHDQPAAGQNWPILRAALNEGARLSPYAFDNAQRGDAAEVFAEIWGYHFGVGVTGPAGRRMLGLLGL